MAVEAIHAAPSRTAHTVHGDASPVDVELPENTLSTDARSLLERTLRSPGADTVEGR